MAGGRGRPVERRASGTLPREHRVDEIDELGDEPRLVVIDDSNRSCGIGAEVMATAAEEMPLGAPPKRVTRPDGAVLPFALDLDRALQPSQDQLVDAIRATMKGK